MNFKFRKPFFFFTFIIVSNFCIAQTEQTDSINTNEKKWKTSSPENLADTVWQALKQKTDEQFYSLLPSLESLKITFDSLELKNNPQILKIKHNYISYRLRKQYKAMKIYARKNGIKFKTCNLNEIKTREGKDEKGVNFSYISLYCSKSKKEFTIKFVALKLGEYWYLCDELRMEMKEDNPYYKDILKKGNK